MLVIPLAMLALHASLPFATGSDAAACPAAPTPTPVLLVPAARAANSSVWNVDCTHTPEALHSRIRLEWIHGADDAADIPLWKTPRTRFGCFAPRCFRAVHDDFASPQESRDLWRGLEPRYGRTNRRGEQFTSIREQHFDDGLLARITSRMAALLVEQYGAVRPKISHLNTIGHWALDEDVAAGAGADYSAAAPAFEQAAERRARVLAGRFAGARGHIDAARPTQWLWTCLLYVGPHDELAGGETLLIDEAVDLVSSTGRVPQVAASKGLLVEPRRGRLLVFTSGAENVHSALPIFGGHRALIQVWWTCDDSAARGVPPSEAAARVRGDASAR